jgi:ribosomal protein S27AE
MAMTTEAMKTVETDVPAVVLPTPGEEIVREDEFRCSRCGLIVLRARLSDPWLRLCPDCTRAVVMQGALC